jgi:AcrR family transcriptional regulator
MIVEAASRYFAEVGFSGPTRDLARRLGVTQPLLYKYFASKAELTEAVFDHISLGRLRPHWPEMLADQTQPLKPRLVAFAGLAGDGLNRRYLEHLSDLLLMPLLAEMRRRAKGDKPDIEDLLSLHGAVIYLGIRKFIYQSGAPDDFMPVIERNVTRFLDAFGLE